MKDIKKDIGNRIKKRRINLGLTRGDICLDESHLTIRQLARIESGESLPSLVKLKFISNKLCMSLTLLINENYVPIPDGYLDQKIKISTQSIYHNKKKIDDINQSFDLIYEKYYDSLPEEEKLYIDVSRSIIDIYLTKNIDFEAGLLNEYFFQIQQKKELKELDLLIIFLYFQNSFFKKYDPKVFQDTWQKAIQYSPILKTKNSYTLISTLILVLSIFIKNNVYNDYTIVLNALNIIIKESQFYEKKPIALMMEAKYFLYSKNDLYTFKKMYNQAKQFATILDDNELLENIKNEEKLDVKNHPIQ